MICMWLQTGLSDWPQPPNKKNTTTTTKKNKHKNNNPLPPKFAPRLYIYLRLNFCDKGAGRTYFHVIKKTKRRERLYQNWFLFILKRGSQQHLQTNKNVSGKRFCGIFIIVIKCVIV